MPSSATEGAQSRMLRPQGNHAIRMTCSPLPHLTQLHTTAMPQHGGPQVESPQAASLCPLSALLSMASVGDVRGGDRERHRKTTLSHAAIPHTHSDPLPDLRLHPQSANAMSKDRAHACKQENPIPVPSKPSITPTQTPEP